MSLDRNHDIVIVGAGISGINAAYRVQTELPDLSYTILESRGGIGGTWDFWKYPGVRSDSDLHTFGFPWQPWTEQKAIADGESIVKYIRGTAAQHGIDKRVEYHHKVLHANWSTDWQSWRLTVSVNGEKEVVYNARYMLLCAGYYDYEEALPTTINGLENFRGTVVHPQFWPEDLDYANKQVAIIGSGATAVTLLPSMAKTAKQVTMVQRSPGYLISLPQSSPIDNMLRKFLPTWLLPKVTRWRFLLLPFLFFNFCRAFPNAARRVMKRRTEGQLPKNVPHDPHFHPYYNPWEQRMCVCPDGDFFKCLRAGSGKIATGQIKTMTSSEIVMENGEHISADIIVTATGLKVQMAGGITPTVDNDTIKIGEKFIWKGILLQDLPNAVFVIGYTNASWTLGADAAAQHFIRLVKLMRKEGKTSVVPRVTNREELKALPAMNLNSTYLKRATDKMPKVADKGPWTSRKNFFSDMVEARIGDMSTGLQFYSIST